MFNQEYIAQGLKWVNIFTLPFTPNKGLGLGTRFSSLQRTDKGRKIANSDKTITVIFKLFDLLHMLLVLCSLHHNHNTNHIITYQPINYYTRCTFSYVHMGFNNMHIKCIIQTSSWHVICQASDSSILLFRLQ